MKIVFMGTPDFSVSCLEALAASKHEVAAAVCQPDKPKGRTQQLCPPPVKVTALEKGIPVYQPATLKNGKGVELLRELEPDIVIVVAYGKILPPDFLSYPKYGCVNIHASLLPKYRGSSPIQWSVLNGDAETGVTSMQMDEGIDTGDILLTEKTAIGENETSEQLFERLAVLGAQVLLETLEQIENGTAVPVKQDEAGATYAG
ncbi:MAG: methionyl-tRNA formyltransferase, partial [Clostridia bacterium]|nr:methionyl-tRNA formyltransferase [Clostridia bacterium]